MPLVVQNGYANVFFGYRLVNDPETMYTALGINFDGVPALGIMQARITEFVSAWHLSFKGITPENYTLGPSHADIGVTDGPNIRFDVNQSSPGEGVTTAQPSNCAYLFHKSTNLGGRAGRGRMYVPGVAGGGVSGNGVITEGVLLSVQNAIDEFYTLVLLIEDIENAVLFHSGETPDPSPITSLACDPVIATQRRRMRP